MINSIQFRNLVVRPTLKKIDLYSPYAEELLIMTMAHESNGGQYLKQVGGGPALGVYQMEKGTFNDLWRSLNDENSNLHKYAIKILLACDLSHQPDAEDMEGNLYLATAMARVYYARVRNPIPTNLDDMSLYAKKYWNTEYGKATAEDYLSAYYRFTNNNTLQKA